MQEGKTMWVVRRKEEEDGGGEDIVVRRDHRVARRVVTLNERIYSNG